MKNFLQKKKLHRPYQDVEHAVPPDFAPKRTLKKPLTEHTVADYTEYIPSPAKLGGDFNGHQYRLAPTVCSLKDPNRILLRFTAFIIV